jgi:DNA-binding transcriptional LysR family regulator
MDLRQLRYFVVVAREGQFVRAATQLHVAQSALSHQVRELEREFDIELFLRGRRGVELTPAGRLLLGHATRLIAAADDARSELARLTGRLGGRLRVGAGAPTGPVRVAAAIATFREEHPEVEVTVVDSSTSRLLSMLDADDLDVLIVSLPAARLPRGTSGRELARESYVIAVAHDHAFARRRAVPLADLRAESLVTFPRGSGIRATIDDALSRAGVEPGAIVAETIDVLMQRDLVAHGMGVALVPESFALSTDHRVVYRPLAGEPLERTLSLVWSERRSHAALVEAFLEFAVEGLPSQS